MHIKCQKLALEKVTRVKILQKEHGCPQKKFENYSLKSVAILCLSLNDSIKRMKMIMCCR